MKRAILSLLLSFCVSLSYAQMTITKDGKSQSTIVIDGKNSTDKEAATILQDFIQRISGAVIPIVENPTRAKKGDILIGDFQLKNYRFDKSVLNEDGFLLASSDGSLRIIGGTDKGSIYGVVTLLESYLGVRYYTAGDSRFEKSGTISLPAINRVENPAMITRRNGSYGFKDPLYAHFMRDDNRNLFAGGYWVHTFERILPTAVYGKSNPEFYSLIDGKRRVGQFSQWCLSNDELFELVCHKVDSIFKANPDQDMISLSDNDNDPRQTTSMLIGGQPRYTHCRCEKCAHLDSMYGGVPMGSRAWFLNKIAERFPDKKFSTLGYLFTRTPPKNITMRPNVNMMVCSIESTHELPYDEKGDSFVDDLKTWSEICSDFYNWDYPMDSRNAFAPMPIFHVYQPNMQLYDKYNTGRLFMCIGQDEMTQFSELRTLIVSKLMWNPNLDMDSLVNSFMADYYGAAAPYLKEYMKLQEGALIASGITHEFYGESPARHANGFLKPALMRRYFALFDKAAEAVKDDAAKSLLVKRDRAALMYAELESIRTGGELPYDVVAGKLAQFMAVVSDFDVKLINASAHTPAEYEALYKARYMTAQKHKAFGAKIEWLTPVTSSLLKPKAETAITDGIRGGISVYDGWVGIEGSDISFVVDMGENKEISQVSLGFIHQNEDWLFMPRSVKYSISEDGKNYSQFGVDSKEDIANYRKSKVSFVDYTVVSASKRQARYIRIDVDAVKIAPDWHPGISLPVWTMIDEVVVN